MTAEQKAKVGLVDFVSHCQAARVQLKPTQALALWRQLGGRIRTDVFWQLWRREEEARARWNGGSDV